MTQRGPASRGLMRIGARLAPASLLVQALSFASSIALATQLGATVETDAYYLALSVPVVAYSVLVSAVRLGVIPPLSRVDANDSPAGFLRSCEDVIGGTLFAAVAISIMATAVMLVVLPAAAGGSAQLSSLTRLYIIELAPYAVTGAMLGVQGAILAVRGRFVIATVVLTFEPVLKSVLVILVGRQIGAQSLVIGNLAGNFAAMLVLAVMLRRSGVAVRARKVLQVTRLRASPIVRDVMTLSTPLFVSQALLQLNPLVDRATAASLGAGDVTVFELGVRLFNVPTALLTGVILAPLAATWSQRFERDGWDAVVRSFSRIVAAMVLTLPPLIVLGYVMRQQLVGVVYLSHRYTAADVTQTANVLGMLLLGLIPQILIVPLSTLFIIRRNTVFPMLVGIANVVLNAVLDVALRGPFGLPGIALSTAVTLTSLCGVFYRQAYRKWGSLGLRIVLRPLLVSTASCVIIVFVSVVLVDALGPAHDRVQALLGLCGVAAIGLSIHAVALALGRNVIYDALPMTRRWTIKLGRSKAAA